MLYHRKAKCAPCVTTLVCSYTHTYQCVIDTVRDDGQVYRRAKKIEEPRLWRIVTFALDFVLYYGLSVDADIAFGIRLWIENNSGRTFTTTRPRTPAAI